jgi:predicted solute-binding protein
LATSTPVLFAVILLISSKEFSQDKIKKQPVIKAAFIKLDRLKFT